MIKTISIFSLLLTLFLTACKDKSSSETSSQTLISKSEIKTEAATNEERFVNISTLETDKLNQIVAEKNLSTEEAIMMACRPKSNETEGKYTYTITKKSIDKDLIEVTLIEDGLLDDSKAGRKTIMTLKKENNILNVISVKENYKCYKNRGHENWDIELCK